MKKLLLAMVVALTACGGADNSNNSTDTADSGGSSGILGRINEVTAGGNSGNGGGGSGSIPSNIVGVWDASSDEGFDGYDEFYVAIDAQGIISNYDYAGDTFDDYGNCFWYGGGSIKLSSLGGSKYLGTYVGFPDETEELDIQVSGNTLLLSYQDIDDEDDDGDTTEMHTETMTRSSRTVASFTPECVDSFAAARALIPAKQDKASVLARTPANKL